MVAFWQHPWLSHRQFASMTDDAGIIDNHPEAVIDLAYQPSITTDPSNTECELPAHAEAYKATTRFIRN
jgi:hypothetical protein